MESKIRCGIVGYGYMGAIRHREVESNSSLELVGIVEPQAEKRKSLPNDLGVGTLDDLLNRSIDAVFVCSPNAFSPSICISALNAGVHVFCEKPPGRSVQDIESIIEAERAVRNLTLMFGFNHRFHPAILKAKSLVDSDQFGKVIGMRGLYGKSGGRDYHESWRNLPEISGGGILLDQGVHMLDLFRLFAEDFNEVKCMRSRSYWRDFEVEDNAYVILGNKHGVHATLHSSATLWKHTFRLELVLEEGYLQLEGLLSKSGSYGRETLTIGKRQFEGEAEAVGNPEESIIYFDTDRSWEMEVESFANCIKSSLPVESGSSYDALRVMQIIDQAYRDSGPLPN